MCRNIFFCLECNVSIMPIAESIFWKNSNLSLSYDIPPNMSFHLICCDKSGIIRNFYLFLSPYYLIQASIYEAFRL